VGTTSHILYACLAEVDSTTLLTLRRTLVHLACGGTSSNTPYEASEKSWDMLSGRTFKAWSGDETSDQWNRVLYYYKPGTNRNQNGTTFIQMISSDNGSGTCEAWAALLYYAGIINGANALRYTFTVYDNTRSKTVNLFAISNWHFPASGSSDDPELPYLINANANASLVIDNTYGDVTNLEGIAGQGSTSPSLKLFPAHVTVAVASTGGSGMILDPSYGRKYVTAQNLPFVLAGDVVGPDQYHVAMRGETRFEVVATPT